MLVFGHTGRYVNSAANHPYKKKQAQPQHREKHIVGQHKVADSQDQWRKLGNNQAKREKASSSILVGLRFGASKTEKSEIEDKSEPHVSFLLENPFKIKGHKISFDARPLTPMPDAPLQPQKKKRKYFHEE